ncbi:rRNA adenine dimethylase [Oceanidesulfovibrio indonesiensis]|jgi:ribulose-5-phosphate 4-epimerase/fuculose-1-phosphate aldolase|uniref:rRNA adenine dimethylase n=1 Tax=Oceanidesulfovibrio indonesiensis TaxID=54767 RepID=A0A7M3MF61_9BACT|nr:class II aldolase/adducin family protein [Oceanidesulfovibrio indonesiensis]TVM17073.1 rRNA adenine dimethylase [Oceanidesulfovibrio indonesiensis]
MKALVDKFAGKIAASGLAPATGEGAPLVAGLDAGVVWSRDSDQIHGVAPLFEALPINSLAWCRPSGSYGHAVRHLAAMAVRKGVGSIAPQDSETRTFLHDIPVVMAGDSEALALALGRRKGVILHDPRRGPALVATGSVSPEQCFVTVSSMAFACFVAFFGQALEQVRAGGMGAAFRAAFDAAVAALAPMEQASPELMAGPFHDEQTVRRAMDQAGTALVRRGLVDSFFGNISCRLGNTLFISQTGAPLDELPGLIDPVPLDGSTCAGLTASSECSAHTAAILASGARTLLHGHPRFSVILSLYCEERETCSEAGRCHVACRARRDVGGAPVVPGEVGTGPTGLSRTLPPALAESGVAVALGHGVFALGELDFRQAFARLEHVERTARQAYFVQIGMQDAI